MSWRKKQKFYRNQMFEFTKKTKRKITFDFKHPCTCLFFSVKASVQFYLWFGWCYLKVRHLSYSSHICICTQIHLTYDKFDIFWTKKAHCKIKNIESCHVLLWFQVEIYYLHLWMNYFFFSWHKKRIFAS